TDCCSLGVRVSCWRACSSKRICCVTVRLLVRMLSLHAYKVVTQKACQEQNRPLCQRGGTKHACRPRYKLPTCVRSAGPEKRLAGIKVRLCRHGRHVSAPAGYRAFSG